VRPIQQPIAEGLGLSRFLAPERARQKPRDRIDHHQRGQLAARQNIIADRPLLVDLALDEALVDPFIAACDQDQARPLARRPRPLLVEPHAIGAQIHCPGTRRHRGPGRPQRIAQRLDLQHHPRASAVGTIVHGAVHIVGVLPGIEVRRLEHAAFHGSSQHAVHHGLAQHGREQRNHRDTHALTAN